MHSAFCIMHCKMHSAFYSYVLPSEATPGIEYKCRGSSRKTGAAGNYLSPNFQGRIHAQKGENTKGEKIMKTNTMMRVASVLLVAVLLSTCAISGTFAKYVTTESGSDSARVAKWGVVIEAESFGMFDADYDVEDDQATFEGEYSVSSAANDRDDLLAPGTKGSFADIKITGTPEVAVDVKIVATVDISENWKLDDGSFYCPVVVTVGTKDFNGLDYQSATDFETAIKEEIDSKSSQYAPNTDLGAIYDNTNLDLSWEWAFEDATGEEIDQSDENDTYLGNLAVNADLTISIGVVITVTQIN